MERDTHQQEADMAKHATGRLFDLARTSNLIRHARKGTLPAHLWRKFVINRVLRALGLGIR